MSEGTGPSAGSPTEDNARAVARKVWWVWWAFGDQRAGMLSAAALDRASEVIRAAIASVERERDAATLRVKHAETLADEVALLVQREVIDSRSPAADALLDFRDPPLPRIFRNPAWVERAALEVVSTIAKTPIYFHHEPPWIRSQEVEAIIARHARAHELEPR